VVDAVVVVVAATVVVVAAVDVDVVLDVPATVVVVSTGTVGMGIVTRVVEVLVVVDAEECFLVPHAAKASTAARIADTFFTSCSFSPDA
jgi:hypothetical protein